MSEARGQLARSLGPLLVAAAHRVAHTAALAITALVWLALAFEIYVRCGAVGPSDVAGFPGSVRIVDARGVLLREAVGASGARAQWRDLDQLSPLVAQATIAVEDARFWDHEGIDGVGVVRAVWDNLRHREVVSGASTITMQLARLLWPHPRSVRGKLGEMVDARRLERGLSKRVILEQYLNRAPYGAGAIGVEAASQRYFGKPSLHLSLAEAALLAGLPKAPTVLNPLRDPAAARARQRHVLARMRATGAISADDEAQAVAEPLIYRRRPAASRGPDDATGTAASAGASAGPQAMHVTDMALARYRPRGGGTLPITVDAALQADVEAAVRDHVDALAASGVTNAAVVILDNEACQIRALVGSADYWDPDGGAVNGALSPRQPGSALKPFTYALAFEQGDTPATVVADIETRYSAPGGEIFSPRNFSGKFSGPVMMGEALGRSLNVPAIRVAERVGAEALLARLRALGLSTLTRSAAYYGLGLTLGNGEVTLLDLAGAYAALARGGLTCRPKLVEKTDMDDFDRSELFNKFNILRDFDRTASSEPRRVFSEQVAFLVTDVLADESLRVTAFGPANSLLLDFPIAVKTGTSANWRDTWAVGYTARYTVAVWAGDFGGRSMNHLAGATGAGPLFHQIATRVHAWDGVRGGARRCPAGGHPHGGRSCTDPGQWPAAPDTVAAVSVCPLSGLRPGPSCPHRRVVHVPRDRQPDGTCDWHREIAIDARTELRAGPLCPDPHVDRRVFEVLPPAYASWSAGAGREAPPAVYSPLCPAAGPIPGSIAITRPRAGDVFVIEPGYDRATQSLRLVAEAEAGVQRVTWAVDGRVVARPGWPYVAEWPLAPGYHTVRATAPGQRGHELRIEVR